MPLQADDRPLDPPERGPSPKDDAAESTSEPGASPLPMRSSTPRASVVRPMLASEALMEDLAPLTPNARSARTWCAAVGLGFILLGAGPLFGFYTRDIPTAITYFALGLAQVATALAPLSYRTRATLMLALGLGTLALGIGGLGPASLFDSQRLTSGGARVVAVVALTAALFFRSRYRAYQGSRWLLLGGFILALPYTLHLVRLLMGGLGDPPFMVGLGAVLALLTLVGASAGFMGWESTGAAAYTSIGVLVAASVNLTLEVMWRLTPQDLWVQRWDASLYALTVGLAFAGTTLLMALGLFQLLACRLAPSARCIDLHRPTGQPPAPPRSSSGDWPTNG